MIKIVQYTKVEEEFYFFLENNNKGLSKEHVEELINLGITNITKQQLDMIVGA